MAIKWLWFLKRGVTKIFNLALPLLSARTQGNKHMQRVTGNNESNYSEQSEVSTQTQTKKVWLHSYSCIMSFLLAISSCFPSPTLRLPNMEFYLQKNTERLQICRILPILFKNSRQLYIFSESPIFSIACYCFFMLLIHVKHGYLFSENLIPSNALPVLANCTTSMALMCDLQNMVARC